MTIVPGRVVNGRIEIDGELPEGAEVVVYVHGADEADFTPEELAELDAAIAEAERGGGVPAEQVLRELRAMLEEASPQRR